MNAQQVEGILFLVVFLAGMFTGWQLCNRQWQKKESKVIIQERENRRWAQLQTTQRNIAGQIYNSLHQGIQSNLQWGYRMLSNHKISDEVSTLLVYDLNNPSQVVVRVALSCESDRRSVRIASSDFRSPSIRVQGPNDTELTIYTGKLLNLLRDWKPV